MNPNRRHLKFLLIIFFSIAALNIGPSRAGAVKYYYQDLGTLGGGDLYNYANCINDCGDVVGSSNTKDETTHAFIWKSSQGMNDLGTIVPGYGYSMGVGINNSGKVVGISSTANAADAFLWTSTDGMKDLGTIGGFSGGSSGTSVNNGGSVVGESYVALNILHAFLWNQVDGMKDLGTLAGGTFSDANSINDKK